MTGSPADPVVDDTGRTGNRPLRRRGIELLVIASGYAAALYLGLRTIDSEPGDWLLGRGARLLVYLGVATLATIGLLAVARTSRARAMVLRAASCALVLLLVVMALTRRQVDQGTFHWPPAAERSMAQRLDELAPAERAGWAARVAMHHLATSDDSLLLSIPADWPLPAGVTLAVRGRLPGPVEVWARSNDSVTACVAYPATTVMGECDATASPRQLDFRTPTRSAPAALPPVPSSIGVAWAQYRGDARKSGIAPAAVTLASEGRGGWRTPVDGQLRATASLVGPHVLVGSHGRGTLSSLDLATGAVQWQARLPNWIHQDAVSDGAIVVVGFGNKWPSFAGRSPSGVAAFDVATGRHRWTAFDEASVMTAPVIRDSVLVYATAAGVARKRLLSSGMLLSEQQLPGGVIMAPPAATGDTIVFSLDHDHVCALLISTMQQLWCRSRPFHRMTGHAGPAISNGTVITSSLLYWRDLSFSELVALPLSLKLKVLRSIVAPTYTEVGQRFEAFRLADGALLWRSRSFPYLHPVDGHTSGTAVVRDSLGVILIPSADSLVGFDARTGHTLWTADAHGSRGPPLLSGDVVLHAGRDGVIQARDLVTGRLRCQQRRQASYDRAGPLLVGDRVIFTEVNGFVESMPLSAVDCSSSAVLKTARVK